MRYAVIENGTVINVILADQGFDPGAGRSIIASNTAGIGDTYNAGTGIFTPFEPPVPEPTPYQIAKTTPWIRMTPAEAELIYAQMQLTEPRLRGIYDAAQYLSSDDELWSVLRDMISSTLGSTARADELLAPEG